MNCLKAKKQKNKLTAEDKKSMSNAISEYFAEKMTRYEIVKYIHENSWDEADFEAKMKHYKETGELPKKIF